MSFNCGGIKELLLPRMKRSFVARSTLGNGFCFVAAGPSVDSPGVNLIADNGSRDPVVLRTVPCGQPTGVARLRTAPDRSLSTMWETRGYPP